MEPVLLTQQQIDELLAEFPPPFGYGKTAIHLAKKYRNRLLRGIFSKIKLVPIPEAFEAFKEEMVRSYYESMAEPGLPAGIIAAISLSAPLTQMTLNTFHFAGSQSGTGDRFQKVKAFVTGSKSNPDPRTVLFFKKLNTGNDLHDVIHESTLQDILNRKAEIEQTTVADVVDGRLDILSKEDVESLGLNKLIQLHSRLRPNRYHQAEDRYKMTYVARIKLNTYRMYTHRITMQMLAEAIEGAPPMNSVTCIWQSQRDGYMYILLDETQDYSKGMMNANTALLLFFTNLTKKFPQFLIRGIAGLSNLTAQEINVLSGITRTKLVNNEIRVYTNHRQTRWQGISLGDISQLLQAAGLEVGPINREKLYVPVLNFSFNDKSLNDKSVVQYVQDQLAAAEKIAESERTVALKHLLTVSSFHVGMVSGTNMGELIWRDDLDLFRTTGNSAHEVAEQFGIDAARVFMIFKFSQDLEEFSSSINYRHVITVFSSLTNLGMINSISFTGASRRKAGPLALASQERGLSVLVNAGAFGERENLAGFSPSIYAGQAPKRIGTHSVEVEEDLSVIPSDQPTLPMFDEITPLTGISVESSGLSIDDLINQGLVSGSETVPLAAPVDKNQILNPSKIYSIGPPAPTTLPLPALPMASSTLQSALNKLTINTGQVLEVNKPPRVIKEVDFPAAVDIPDITSLEVWTGIKLSSVQLASPNILPSTPNVAGLKSVNLPISPSISSSVLPVTEPPTTLKVSRPINLVSTLPTVAPVISPIVAKEPEKLAIQLFVPAQFQLVTPPPAIQRLPETPRVFGQTFGPALAAFGPASAAFGPALAALAAPTISVTTPAKVQVPIVPVQPIVPVPAQPITRPNFQFPPVTLQSILAKFPTPAELAMHAANSTVTQIDVNQFRTAYNQLFPKAVPIPSH